MTNYSPARAGKTASLEELIMAKDKYPSIVWPQMEALVFIILQILICNKHSFENWGIFSNSSQFQLGIFSHMTCLDQLHTS